MSSRSNNPFVAALFGILLVPGSMALQAWNEYRTIHRTRGLNEAEEIVVSIEQTSSVSADLNGKLVHLAGEAITEERLRDPDFGIEENAIQLRRVVKMYQWDEDKKTDDGNTTYSYKKVWRDGRINSDEFHHSSGHHNPNPAFGAWQQIADGVMVGSYEVSDTLKRQKDDYRPVAFELDSVRQSLEARKRAEQASHMVANGDQLFYSASHSTPVTSSFPSSNEPNTSDVRPSIESPSSAASSSAASTSAASSTATSEDSNETSTEAVDSNNETDRAAQPDIASQIDPSSPQIGDLRIQFEMVPNGPVSLMAGLQGNTFASYKTSNGEPIERLYPEQLTAEQVVANMRAENSIMAWILRGVGFALCMVGMLMIFAPAQALFRWVPFVGDIAGVFMFVVALSVAAILSLLTISISWIAVRPVLSLGLLAIAGTIVYLLYQKKKSNDRTYGQDPHPSDPVMRTDDIRFS